MKYIRTINGIYDVEEWFKPLENDMVYIPNEGLNKILNQADTIEELCDEFVWAKHLDDLVFRNLYKKIDIQNKVLIGDDNKLHYQPRNELEIYGAIWTDKGLIYVAKMNGKGELELL